MAAEIEERQAADAAQRQLLDAYYSGAIDVPTLKAEQAGVG